MRHVVALFGEAERGKFKTPYFLNELPQLVDLLGNPPAESEGLFFAIQALLFERELIFFRVEDEGYSHPDYFQGFKTLTNRDKVQNLHALCLPGVADSKILEASHAICELHRSFLITTEKDLYDYLMS